MRFSLILFIIILTACGDQVKRADTSQANEITPEIGSEPTPLQDQQVDVRSPRFEPKDGQCILFVGQTLDAIGGLDEYSDGYVDYFDMPAGISLITKLRPQDSEFAKSFASLSGIFDTHDWGDGPSNMSSFMSDIRFINCAVSLGLDIVGYEKSIAGGELDNEVTRLGDWLKALSPRPIFLRIGPEFNGPWNAYDPQDYVGAFKRIRHLFDDMNIVNVAYVWQSTGNDKSISDLSLWYPGDAFVDWCAFSAYSSWDEVMIEFATNRGKPVFIAEASPILFSGNTIQRTKFSFPEDAAIARDRWFKPLFELIKNNPNTIKAVSYINSSWTNNKSWRGSNPEVDARIQLSPVLLSLWNREIKKTSYLKGNDGLYRQLWGDDLLDVAVIEEVDSE